MPLIIGQTAPPHGQYLRPTVLLFVAEDSAAAVRRSPAMLHLSHGHALHDPAKPISDGERPRWPVTRACKRNNPAITRHKSRQAREEPLPSRESGRRAGRCPGRSATSRRKPEHPGCGQAAGVVAGQR